VIPVTPKPSLTLCPPELLAAAPTEAEGEAPAFEQLIAALFAPESPAQPLPADPAALPAAEAEGDEASAASPEVAATTPEEDPIAVVVASLPILAELPVAPVQRATPQPTQAKVENAAPGAALAPAEADALPIPGMPQPRVMKPATIVDAELQARPADGETEAPQLRLDKQAVPLPQLIEAARQRPEMAAPILPLLKLVQAQAQAKPQPQAVPVRPAPEPVPQSIAAAVTAVTAPVVEPLPTLAPLQPALPQPASVEAVAQPDAAAQIVEQQLDLAHEGEWLDRLARDIARTADNEGTLKFRLNPETLGALKVEVTQGAAGASVRMTADTEAAKTIIADAQPRLVAEARAQGVRIAETHVELGMQTGSGDSRRQAQQTEPLIRTASAEAEADAAAAPTDTERYA
jgi:flagellar hook-length control protein FliK